MSNFTWNIKRAKIFGYGSKQVKAWGKLVWTDGTAPFEIRFQTLSQEVMKTIEQDNKGPETSFKVSGSLVINHGYGDHVGKTFQNYVIEEIEVVND